MKLWGINSTLVILTRMEKSSWGKKLKLEVVKMILDRLIQVLSRLLMFNFLLLTQLLQGNSLRIFATQI